MAMKRYFLMVGVVTLVWVAALLTIPAFSQFIEQLMLLFLSRTAS
ncbi:MAG TPA: hypothetical protein VF210_08225 [Pseudomonadales bacterium]